MKLDLALAGLVLLVLIALPLLMAVLLGAMQLFLARRHRMLEALASYWGYSYARDDPYEVLELDVPWMPREGYARTCRNELWGVWNGLPVTVADLEWAAYRTGNAASIAIVRERQPARAHPGGHGFVWTDVPHADPCSAVRYHVEVQQVPPGRDGEGE